MSLKQLYVNFMKRRVPLRGQIPSDSFNSSMEEIGNDLANLASEHIKLKTLTDTLPDGTEDTTLDVWTNGLDGANLWTDESAGTTSLYWDSTNSRPRTVRESLDDLHVRITNTSLELQESITENSVALTTAQKERIGINIFDGTLTSSTISLDGKSERNRLNTIQLAKDLYGASYYTLDSDGVENLLYSVRDMVGALLDAHGGTWNADITLTHSGISIVVNQDAVNNSLVYNDLYVGVPADLQDDLNQIRTEINEIRGAGTWTTGNSQLFPGGPGDLENLFVATNGTGTKTGTNPWGYKLHDLDEVTSGLDLMTTKVVASGLPNDMPDGITAQEYLSWMTSASGRIDGQYFRRMETGVAGPGPFIVNHDRSSYPLVQLVQLSPSVTVSGQYAYTTEHLSQDEFRLSLPTGVSLVSGVIVSIW